jgi:predicted nucleotidyltransferase
MVINLSKTQLGILESLSIKWYDFLSISEISIFSKVPESSIYRSIKTLKEKNIIIELDARYKINFSNDIGWAIKKLVDAYRLNNLPHDIKNKIINIREKAGLFFGNDIKMLFVFGSSASLELKEESDIDFLIVLSKKTKENFLKFLTTDDRNFNFIEYDIKEFNDAYNDGDDFLISVLKNHILLQGDEHIHFLMKRGLPTVSKKVIHDREIQLNNLKIKIDELFFQDQPIVCDKIKEYIKLKVRIMLMKKDIIPLSNKNLFDLMKQYYLKYYRAYNNLNMKDAANIYTDLERS